MTSDLALNCRNLCREYYDLMDNRSSYVNKLQGELRMAFPLYLGIFSKVTINTSLTLLETYTSPNAFINTDKQEVIDVIKLTVCFGLTYAQKKYNAIIQAANDINEFGYIIDNNIKRIRLYIRFIRKYDDEIADIMDAFHELVDFNEDTDFVKQIHLIETFKGADFLSAVSLMAEIDDFSAFSKPKLVAMGAVSHKVCNMIFAILRDIKPFEIITP